MTREASAAKSWIDLQAWCAALMAAPLGKDVLTNGDKVVGVRLSMHLNLKTGRCFPKVDSTLTHETAMSRQGVQGALQRLVAGGWISRIERIGTSSEFRFLMGNVSLGGPTTVGTPRQSQRAPGANQGRQGGQPQLASNLKSNIEENLESPSAQRSNFKEWFAVYPWRAGERQARKEFERIIASGKVSVEQLIIGARNYAAERAGQNPRYTMKPANWLKDEGWRDEPLMPVERSGASRSTGSGYAIIAARLRARGVDEQEEETRQPARDLQSNLAAALASAPAASRATVRITPPPVVRPAAPKRPPREDPKRGQYETEIIAVLGYDVFANLPVETIEDLCRRWPAKKVPLAELERLKLDHAQTRATGPPAATAGRAVVGNG